MSEFACKLGCLMGAEERKNNRCAEHGLPIHTMDGMTAKQVMQMERQEAGYEPEDM